MSQIALEKPGVAADPAPVTETMAWWGMLLFILTEAALFGFLLFSYYYVAIQPRAEVWPAGGLPSVKLSLPNTVILLASSGTAWFSEHAAKRGRRRA